MIQQRSRAWRRQQARRHACRKRSPKMPWDYNEKNWKLLYTRSVKTKRAVQLKRIWPYRNWKDVMTDSNLTNILFVCSQNKWRSPTGEAVFRKDAGLSVRSAGTSRNARRTINMKDIQWADIIFVMEDKHKSRLRADFRQAITHKTIHVLDIPDDYQYMDPELVEIIRTKAEPLIWDKCEV